MATIEITGNWNATLQNVFPDEYRDLVLDGHSPSARKARKAITHYSDLFQALYEWSLLDLLTLKVDGEVIIQGETSRINWGDWTNGSLFRYEFVAKSKMSDDQVARIEEEFLDGEDTGWKWIFENAKITRKMKVGVKKLA